MAYETMPYNRRRRPSWGINPRVIIVALIVIFLLLCLIGRGTFSRLGCSRAGALKDYINETRKVTDQSNKFARDFNDVKNNIKEVSRKELNQRLDNLARSTKKIASDARKIEPPAEMEKANLYLILSLDLRASSFDRLKPAIFNALADKDLEVAAKQVSFALKDLTLSDRAFSLFHSEAQKVLGSHKVSFVSAPSSVYLSSGAEYEIGNVLDFLKDIQGVSSLSEIHGVAIAELSVKPEAKSEINGVSKLPNTDSISMTVTVENQGNQVEVNIPVKITLKSETQPKAQEARKTIGSLSPKQKKSVTIVNLKPTTGDIINLLTVTAGPVPGEKFLENNTLEYKFTVERK